MTQALDYLKDTPQDFTAPPSLYAVPERVRDRDQRLERDNGLCKNTFELSFFQSPPLAGCKVNEVDVPSVVGSTLAAARQRLLLQPLGTSVVYEPRRPASASVSS